MFNISYVCVGMFVCVYAVALPGEVLSSHFAALEQTVHTLIDLLSEFDL